MRPPLTPPSPGQWTMSDGYVLRGRVWIGPPRPRACVLYFHGIQSHGGWYEWSASVLASSGCAVVLPDRRGSGLCAPPRGDVGSIARWREDVDAVADWASAQFLSPRLAVLGMSWGGKLAADLAWRRPEIVERLLLLTPGVFPAVDVGFVGRLRIAASLLAGGRGEHLIPLSDPALFTDNPAGQSFIEQDALKLTHATARFLWHSARLEASLRRLPAGAIRVPTQLVLAQGDRIIRNEPTVNWVRRVVGPSADVHSLTGAHTLEFAESVRDFQDLLSGWTV